MERTPELVAVDTILHGRPYARRVAHEGTPESGPYAVTYRGVRWGQVKVEVSPRGQVCIILPVSPDAPDEYTDGRWERYCPIYAASIRVLLELKLAVDAV